MGERCANDMKNIAVFNNSTGVVGVLESLLNGEVHMIKASTLEECTINCNFKYNSKNGHDNVA